LAAVCLGPTDRCNWRSVEAESVLRRAGDVRAAAKLLALVRVFLLGDVRPKAEWVPAVTRGTTDRGDIATRLAVAEAGQSLARGDLGLDVALGDVRVPGSVTPPLQRGLTTETSKAFSMRRAEFCSFRCNRAAHCWRIRSMLCFDCGMSFEDSPCMLSVATAASAASLEVTIASCSAFWLRKCPRLCCEAK